MKLSVRNDYQCWPLALMQNRPGGGWLLVLMILHTAGAGGGGNNGLQKMFYPCELWIWPAEKEISYSYTWVSRRHGKLWRITRGGNVRITAWWIVKYGLAGFNRVPKSPPVPSPHDLTYWNTPITQHIISRQLKMSYQTLCKYDTVFYKTILNSVKYQCFSNENNSTQWWRPGYFWWQIDNIFKLGIFETLLTDAFILQHLSDFERQRLQLYYHRRHRGCNIELFSCVRQGCLYYGLSVLCRRLQCCSLLLY